MKRLMKSLFMLMTALSFALGNTCIVSAKPRKQVKVKLNVTKKTVDINKSFTLKLKNNKQKVIWYASNKKVKLSKKKKTSVLVTGKKKGISTVTAKIGKRKYKCKVTIKTKKSKPKKAKKKKIAASAPEPDSVDDESTDDTDVDDIDEPEEKTTDQKVQEVRDYILKNGTINNNGDHFIKNVEYDENSTNTRREYGIVCKGDGTLSFIYNNSYTGTLNFKMQTVIGFDYYYPSTRLSIEAVRVIQSSDVEYDAENSFDGTASASAATLSHSSKPYWEGKDKVFSLEDNQDADTNLSLALYGFDDLLYKRTNYYLKDIGFINC